MKQMIFGLAISLMFSAQAFAGAANGTLNCKSADGKAHLSGEVPVDFEDFDVKAEFPGHPMMTTEFYSRLNQTTGQQESNGRMVVVQDLKNGVYTMNATDNDVMAVLVRLYALPKTVKYKSNEVGYDASFEGKLLVSSENGMEEATVKCLLHYSI